MEQIIELGAVITACSAIIALLVKIWRLTKRVTDGVEKINQEIGDLQYERLAEAHDHYVRQGWCPSAKKEMLCNMYRDYTAKGRNHLTKAYEQEILALPSHPPKEHNTCRQSS